MTQLKPRHVVALLLVLVAALLACKKNEDATKACASQSSSEDCQKCCQGQGSNGHTYVNGKCSCLGG
jgi:hypothetical protein